jgi:hypothetical protein
MTHIYSGAFIAPTKPSKSPDGRAEVLGAIARLHKGAPLSPKMQKRAVAADKPSAFGAEADETLDEIKKAHATGRRPGLPGHTAQGDEEMKLKSVNMIKRALANPLRVTGSRPLTAGELNKHFAARRREVDIDGIANTPDADMRKGWDIPSAQWNAMTPQERIRWVRKVKAGPRSSDREVTDNYGRGARENSNGNWDDTHANTGATNNFRDSPAPALRPTVVGGQVIGSPTMSQRDAAIDAIKRDLSKPKRMGQRDEDEDAGGMDIDMEDRAQDPNRDDAFDNDPNARGYGKQRRRA